MDRGIVDPIKKTLSMAEFFRKYSNDTQNTIRAMERIFSSLRRGIQSETQIIFESRFALIKPELSAFVWFLREYSEYLVKACHGIFFDDVSTADNIHLKYTSVLPSKSSTTPQEFDNLLTDFRTNFSGKIIVSPDELKSIDATIKKMISDFKVATKVASDTNDILCKEWNCQTAKSCSEILLQFDPIIIDFISFLSAYSSFLSCLYSLFDPEPFYVGHVRSRFGNRELC